MKFQLIIFLISSTVLSGFGQQIWTNYVNDRLIEDILVDGNNVWVGSQGGLTRTNIETGEFQTYLAGNCPIKGGGVAEIEKAPDGAMWFGSENGGVFRLYQDQWTHYYNGIVDSLYEDIENLQILSNGDVWFFVEKRGYSHVHKLVRIREGNVQSFDGLPSEQYSYCLVDENTLYITNKNNIYKYDVLTENITATFNAGNSVIETTDEIWDIRRDKNGTLIIPATTRILQLNNDVLSELSQPGLEVLTSFTDDAGNIYFQSFTNNIVRLVKYDGNQTTYFTDQDFEPIPAEDAPIFRGGDVTTGLYASIFTLDSEYTLYRFNSQGWHPVRSQIFPMLTNYQRDVQADCDGNLWFNSRDGIDVRYANGTWENFRIPTQPYTYFLSDKMTVDPVTCDVWFNNTSNSGGPTIPGIIRISNGVVSSFLLGHSNVYDVLASPDGKIYFLSGNTGFGYIQNDQVFMIDEWEEFQFAVSLDMDSKGNVYIGAWDSKMIQYNGHSFDHLGSGDGGDYVYRVMVDNDDLVWVITSNGLMQFNGVNWNNVNQVWSDVDVSHLVQDREGHYWVATYNDGLFYWDGQNVQHYDILNSGLTTDRLYRVNLDPNGNLIVTQNVGVSVLEIPEILESYRGSGTVYFDADKNGNFSSVSDVLVPGRKVKNLTNNLWSMTNPSGTYAFYSDVQGDNQFHHELNATSESTTANPQTASFTDYASTLPDFGFWTNEESEVQMSLNNGVMICDREFIVQISFQNKGFYPVAGNLTLNYPDIFSFVNSSLPPSNSSSGQLLFNELALQPFEWKNIKLTFKAPGIDSEGMEMQFESVYETTDTTLTSIIMDNVLCSYDPNDKKVEPVGDFVEHTSLIKDPIRYTIRFQNEGTYRAFDVVILDTLDAALDPATFELVANSHEVAVTISPEGIVRFVFANINLPAKADDEAGSQGFVSFTIRPDSTIITYQDIYNKASIYFDFNPPIVTNTTFWHLTDDLNKAGIEEPKFNISIYPNPTVGHLIIESSQKSIYHIFDTSGKWISTGQLKPGRNNIQLDVKSGLYFLQIMDGSGRRVVEKVVRM